MNEIKYSRSHANLMRAVSGLGIAFFLGFIIRHGFSLGKSGFFFFLIETESNVRPRIHKHLLNRSVFYQSRSRTHQPHATILSQSPQ